MRLTRRGKLSQGKDWALPGFDYLLLSDHSDNFAEPGDGFRRNHAHIGGSPGEMCSPTYPTTVSGRCAATMPMSRYRRYQ